MKSIEVHGAPAMCSNGAPIAGAASPTARVPNRGGDDRKIICVSWTNRVGVGEFAER